MRPPAVNSLRLRIFSLVVFCIVLFCGLLSSTPSPVPADDVVPSSSQIMIPGPLPSFLRMAAISRKVPPEQVIPLLSHNVFELGYVAGTQPTEYLVLLDGYIKQARELTALAGPDGALHVSNCDDSKNLLLVLGYRVKGNCGQNDAYVETADPKRAFLTIDSGFPLPELEEALRGHKAFNYPY